MSRVWPMAASRLLANQRSTGVWVALKMKL
jgi:hypothetical protein